MAQMKNIYWCVQKPMVPVLSYYTPALDHRITLYLLMVMPDFLGHTAYYLISNIFVQIFYQQHGHPKCVLVLAQALNG